MDLRQRGAVHQVGGGGTQTIHYGDGTTLTGTEITNFGQWEGGVLACNDGATVRILGSGEYYFSTDSKLTSHPAVWSFGSVTDGMVIDQRSYYVVKSDRSSWLQESNQLLLFDIQEVKVLEGTYSQAVIIWYLDAQYAFAPLDLAMLKPGLKILPPRSSDTRGYAVTGFDVFGLHTGLIASGDVDAQSGGLRESAELRAVVQPSASGFGDLAGVWQLHGLSAPGGEWTNWVRGTWTVNTDGSSDGLLHRSNGTTSPLRGTVTMASYGVFRVDPFQYTHGVIGSDRNLMVLVTTDSRGEHQMLLGIRSGTAAVGATPCPCPDDDPADGIYRICNYWPLHPGNQWIYTTGDYTVLNETYASTFGWSAVRLGTRTYHYDMFLHNCEHGLAYVAYQNLCDGTFAQLDPHRVLIPPEMRIGMSFRADYTDLSPGGIPGPYMITTTCVGLETITVPAGKFTPLRFDVEINDIGKGSYTMRFWFVKNLGMVKFQRVNPSPADYLGCIFTCRCDDNLVLRNAPAELVSALVDGRRY